MHPKAMANIFRVIATERRLTILRILLDADGPVSPSIISGVLGLDDGPVSYNMSELASVGLVSKAVSGRHTFWTPNRIVVQEILSFWQPENMNGTRERPVVDETGTGNFGTPRGTSREGNTD